MKNYAGQKAKEEAGANTSKHIRLLMGVYRTICYKLKK